MAEAWARRLFPEDWSVASAGLMTHPITERTREAMAEVGLDMAGQYSKTLDVMFLDDFDLVVTLSEESGRFLPRLKNPSRHVPSPVSDPMVAYGTPLEIQEAFREGRDRIRAIVSSIAKGLIGPAENQT
jgi:arsenate reductase